MGPIKNDIKNDHFLWDIPAAFVLLTRLPMPRLPEAAFQRGARGVWAYPVVGLGLGAVLALALGLLQMLGVGAAIAAGLGLGLVIVITGAMHEDGLADVADGFWGGFEPARRLEIMKDSRIGAYGVLALGLALGLRWLGYAQAGAEVLIVALMLSRAMMPVLMRALPHARADGLSHSVGRPGWRHVAAGLGLSLVISLALIGPLALFALVVAGGVTAAVGALARAKIGGQTGDVLGATQVITEIALLVLLTAG